MHFLRVGGHYNYLVAAGEANPSPAQITVRNADLSELSAPYHCRGRTTKSVN